MQMTEFRAVVAGRDELTRIHRLLCVGSLHSVVARGLPVDVEVPVELPAEHALLLCCVSGTVMQLADAPKTRVEGLKSISA